MAYARSEVGQNLNREMKIGIDIGLAHRLAPTMASLAASLTVTIAGHVGGMGRTTRGEDPKCPKLPLPPPHPSGCSKQHSMLQSHAMGFRFHQGGQSRPYFIGRVAVAQKL